MQTRPPLVLIPIGLLVLVLWAMMSSGAGAGSGAHSLTGQIAMLVLFGLTFSALALDLVGRRVAVAIGAAASLLAGILLKFYFPDDAARYLVGKVDTLVLLAAVGVVTGLLEESGFFASLARRTVASAGEKRWAVMARLCVLTYLLSLFMNNLAAIVVIIPLSLRIADELDLDPVPLVLGEIIASNLGGASTMVGDFPNMLIATEIGLPFHDFLLHLAPICLVELAILIAWLSPAFSDRQGDSDRRRPVAQRTAPDEGDPAMAFRGQLILAAMIVGFLVCGWIGVSPAVVAACAAALAIVAGGMSLRRLARHMCLGEVFFFACLFVMVGAVGSTGILDAFGAAIGDLWSRSPVWAVFAVIWGAALLTSFLNAGPTTALLIHVLLAGLGVAAQHEIIWWALSLGVCAGSSGTLTGATAGPVAAGLLERHGSGLTFARFARTGIPLMVLFAGISTCYLVVLVHLTRP